MDTGAQEDGFGSDETPDWDNPDDGVSMCLVEDDPKLGPCSQGPRTTFYPSLPLGLNPRETRLLELLPGSSASPICCTLAIHSLNDHPV
jgi:hypothetical protein